ncbi:MAG: type 4a pilus biogenesis protein PilO [Patescibacteria group bacterium]
MAQGWKKDYTRYKSFFLNVLGAYNAKPNLKIYLELMLSLGTIIVFAIFAIKPTIITIVDINNEIKAKEETIEKLQNKLVDLQTANSILKNEAQNLKLIDEAVPNSASLELVAKQIESLVSSNSINLTSLTSSDVKIKGQEEKTENELLVSFSVNGDYQNLFAFLQSIENMRRPFKIDSLIFNISKSVDEKKLITLTLSGTTPFITTNKNKSN